MKLTIAWHSSGKEPPLPGAVLEGDRWVIELRDLAHLLELCQENTIMFKRTHSFVPKKDRKTTPEWSEPVIWVDIKGHRFEQR